MNNRLPKLGVSGMACRNRRQGGFSLIELMVSITLGLLVMAGVLALYVDLTRSNAELAKMNRQIENGRFVMQLLQHELWHAGFWDTHMPSSPSISPPAEVPNPCVAFSTWDAGYVSDMFLIPVQGYAAGNALPVECSGIVTNPQPDSDVLVIRYASTCVAGAVGCEDYDEAKLYLQNQMCGDAGHANYVASAEDTPVLGAPGMTVYKKNCTTVADRRKLRVSMFYVRNYSVAAGDGIPTFMRADFDKSGGDVIMQSAQPVIEGVQSVKFEYGRDLDDDGVADVFDDCALCTALDWANVVAVQVHVLARNLEASSGHADNKTYRLGSITLGPFNDGFTRHVYTGYVHLVNQAGRREKP